MKVVCVHSQKETSSLPTVRHPASQGSLFRVTPDESQGLLKSTTVL